MLAAVHPTPLRALVAATASVNLGLGAALALRLSSELFGAGPLPAAASLAAASAALLAVSPSRRAAPALLALSAALVFGFGSAARFGAWIGGYASLPLAAGLIVTVSCLAATAPARASAARAGRAGPLLAAAALGASGFLGTEALALAAILTALPAILAGEPPVADRPAGLRRDALSAAAGLVAAVAALTIWATLRVPLDPTPRGFLALVAAAIGAMALAPTSAAARAVCALLGVAILGATGWTAWDRLPELAARGPWAGAFVFAAVGLGAGLGFAGARPSPRAAVLALAAAAAAVPPVLGALPAGVVERAARAEVTAGSNASRLEAARARTTLVSARVGAVGGTVLRAEGERTLVELDGTVADPETRAGAAERFAGTLAACATAERTRARAGGDDLGLAVEALRAQGFLAIDTAVPDAALARAQAEIRPSLSRTWLHPSVRLVALPGPAVLRAGPRADAVVEIVRAPWTDGRRTVPTARDLAFTRGTLSPAGVHVLALAATALPDGALLAALHAFQSVYPDASLWLPPEGADTALLLGTTAGRPLQWAGFERCVAADEAALRRVSVRTAVDLGALALADGRAIAALPPGTPLGRGLPDTLAAPPALSVAALPALEADPTRLFADAPAALADRAESRRLFLELLREATGGDIQSAIARARALGAAPGGARALEPVLKPHLERARQAMARGAREGIASKAWEEAEAALGTARALAPDHAATLCLEGELAGARGQLSRAEEAFEACAAADPESLAGHDGLARARRSRGNLTGAEEALRAALRARPDTWTTAHNLGVFLLELGRYEEAERLLKQAVASQARDADALAPAPYLALARLYLATGRAELALAQSERAQGMAPSADALALRGAARFELRQPDIAEEDFRAALALDARHALALGGIGQIQATRGEYELAATSFRAVLEIEPQNPVARENLARLARLVEAQAE